jgi:hypothetical protein
VSGGGGSFSHLTYHAGRDWRVKCNTYADTTPILSVDGGPISISITTRRRDAGAGAVEFARALALEAQKFADEIERIHAAQLADANRTDKGADVNAA